VHGAFEAAAQALGGPEEGFSGAGAEPFDAGTSAAGPRGEEFAVIGAEAEAAAQRRLGPAGPPRGIREVTLGEVAFGMGSEAGAWDRVVGDDHLSKVQVQEGPGLR